jgi:hypothetical protein
VQKTEQPGSPVAQQKQQGNKRYPADRIQRLAAEAKRPDSAAGQGQERGHELMNEETPQEWLRAKI